MEQIDPNQLKLARRRARLKDYGPTSDFKKWWFFDTNCLSEMVKLSRDGYSRAVDQFLLDKPVLISSLNLMELRKAPSILLAIPNVMSTAKLFLLEDSYRFEWADIYNFLQQEISIPFNVMDVYPLPKNFMSGLLGHNGFLDASTKSEAEVDAKYVRKVMPDIGLHMSIETLCVYIWKVVDEIAQKKFGISVPIQQCNSMNFPAFYTYWYTYYFK